MTLLKQFLLSVARGLLYSVAALFVRRGYIESKDAPTYVEAAADWVVPVAIAVAPVLASWLTAKGRVIEAVIWRRIAAYAAASPPDTPIRTIESAVRSGAPLVVISRNVQVGQPTDQGPEAA